MKKLAIITTHPIQYYAPVFKLLHQRQKVAIKVFYTWGDSVTKGKYDPGFDKKIAWDVPLLEGYPYEWAQNSSKDAGTHHFMGIVNRHLIAQVDNWQPDSVLIYGWGFYSHLKVIRHFKNKVPVLFRGDSTLLDEKKSIKSFLKSVFLKWIYNNIDHALYVGANNKAYFKKYGLKEAQLHFAPHAVDNDRFADDRPQEVQLFRKELGIRDDDLVVLFAGKLEEKKDPLSLLLAFSNLKRQDIQLVFAGNGPLEKQLKSEAKNRSNVHFLDFQNQSKMPVLYQACNLFCLPSQGPAETWGLSINEAMACGKAILVSDKAGAAIDLVVPGENGAIFTAGNRTDLTHALEKLTGAGAPELARMGKNSKELIKSWNFANQVKTIEEITANE
ncbi:MAG: glycosyltransferase family 4 protein [Sphingobacteriales bacterium]